MASFGLSPWTWQHALPKIDILLCRPIRLMVVREAGNMMISYLFHVLVETAGNKVWVIVRQKCVKPSTLPKMVYMWIVGCLAIILSSSGEVIHNQ